MPVGAVEESVKYLCQDYQNGQIFLDLLKVEMV